MAGKGRPKGSTNKPRGRMVAELYERYPDLNLLAEMYEQYQHAAALVEERAKVDRGEAEPDGEHVPVTIGDRNQLQQMAERPLKFLLPQLKAMDVKHEGHAGGPITVVFGKPDE